MKPIPRGILWWWRGLNILSQGQPSCTAGHVVDCRFDLPHNSKVAKCYNQHRVAREDEGNTAMHSKCKSAVGRQDVVFPSNEPGQVQVKAALSS